MYATDFKFDGELASSYGLIICSFNGAGDVQSIRNGADVTLTTSRMPSSNVWHHVNAQYSEVLTTTIQVMKSNCDDKQNLYFTVEEQQIINRWLNRLDNYYPFKIVQEGFENIYFNAQINVNKMEINGRVIGFELTVTTDKPYAYYDEHTESFQLGQDGTYEFLDISNEVGNSDIVMNITCLQDGSLSINNSLTNQTMTIDDCTNGEVISIDTENRKVSSSVRTSAELLKKFNFKWLQVCNTRDNRSNIISSTLPIDVEILYNPVCKIGF